MIDLSIPIQKIDCLPKIAEYLTKETTTKVLKEQHTKAYDYEITEAMSNISSIIKPYFTNNWIIGKMIINSIRPIHIDPNRTWVFNYIVNTGGDNVLTNFYTNDKKTITHSIKCEKDSWYLLNTQKFHSVRGLLGTRVMICVYTKGENFDLPL